MMNDKYKPFSERYGYTQPKLPQRERMDVDLRNGLWNAFYASFPSTFREFEGNSNHPIYRKIFGGFLKRPLDEYLDYLIDKNNATIKQIFLSEKWHRVFDLVEYVVQLRYQVAFVDTCNAVFTQENSAYRIIAGGGCCRNHFQAGNSGNRNRPANSI